MNNIFGKPAVAIILVATLIGCGKIDRPGDEWKDLVGDKPLRFSSAVAPTKASSPLVSGATFGVFAFLQEGNVANGTVAHWADDWDSQTDGTQQPSPNFMFNQLVSKTGADDSNETSDYTYSPLHYWPSNKENTLSFWAYGPHNPSVSLFESGTSTTYTETSHGLPDVQFTVADGRDDFMTSDLLADQDYSSHDGVASFEFHHRLSWIEFKAATAADYTDLGITFTVTSIRIIHDYSTGVYRQSSSGWSNLSSERDESDAITAFSGTVLLEYNNPKPCSNYPVLMLPQDMDHTSNGGGKVTVLINFNQRDGSGQYNINKEVAFELDQVSGIDAWEKNKRYIYTILVKSDDAINLTVQVQPWEYWLGTSDYTESVTTTKQLTWDDDTYVTGSGSNCTEEASFTIDGVSGTYKVLVLKPGTSLKGSFIFDTPYRGTWYAMLEPINGSNDGSIVFSNDKVLTEGLVGNESTIEIKASGDATTAQYAVLRFMCRTVPVDPNDPSTAQTLYVSPATLGGQYVIKQNIN